MLLRSKTPDLIRREFYGLMMAHFAVRGLMHEAALRADRDPDRLSFTHRAGHSQKAAADRGSPPPQARPAFHEIVLRELLDEPVSSSRTRRNLRGVKRKMSNWNLHHETCPALQR